MRCVRLSLLTRDPCFSVPPPTSIQMVSVTPNPHSLLLVSISRTQPSQPPSLLAERRLRRALAPLMPPLKPSSPVGVAPACLLLG